MYSVNNDLSKIGRVSPFRYLRIKACLPAPRSFSQASTSFFAFDCQGIHLLRLFTWFENPTRYSYGWIIFVFWFFSSLDLLFKCSCTFQYTPLLKVRPPRTKSKYLIFEPNLNVKIAKFNVLDFLVLSLNATYPEIVIQQLHISFLEDHKKILLLLHLRAFLQISVLLMNLFYKRLRRL